MKSEDISILVPFVHGTVHVLKVQCFTAIKTEKPLMKANDKTPLQTDIAGIIGITSPTFNGSIALCFSEKTFLYLMSKMLGEEFTTLTPDLEDGAGEMLNMIFGYAKRVLNEKGHSFEKALPTIVRGTGISLSHHRGTGAVILPFDGECGKFYMEINTETK